MRNFSKKSSKSVNNGTDKRLKKVQEMKLVEIGILVLTLLIIISVSILYLNKEDGKSPFSSLFNKNKQVSQEDKVFASNRTNINNLKKADSNNYDIVIGLDSWIGSTPITYALKNGFDKKNSIKIGVEEIYDDTTKMQALMDGKLDIAFITLSNYIKMQNDYQNSSTVIGLSDFSYGSEAILAKSDIKETKGLKGKKITLIADDISKFVLYKFLNLSGLNISDITLNQKSSLNEVVAELKDDKADATVSYCPEMFTILNAVNSKKPNALGILATSKDFQEIMPTVIVCNSDFAKKHKKEVVTFLKTYFDGTNELHLLKGEMYNKVIEATKEFPNIYGNVSVVDVEDSFSDILLLRFQDEIKYFNKNDPKIDGLIKDIINIWNKYENIPLERMKADIYDYSYIEELKQIIKYEN